MTTRYKIAEQVARIVSGGDLSEDNSIDIREVMLLVDQERNSLIKSEIMDWMYTKSTATAKGELEINGAWLSHGYVTLKQDLNLRGLLYAPLSDLGITNYISLPNDMGIQRVASNMPTYVPEIRVVKVDGGIHKPEYKHNNIDVVFDAAPKVLNKKYKISFDFNIIESTMSDGSSTQHLHGGVRANKIEFDVYPGKYDKYESHQMDIRKAIINSPGFKKFVKDYDIKYRGYVAKAQTFSGSTSIDSLIDTDTQYITRSGIRLSTKYGSTVTNFKIDNTDAGGLDTNADASNTNNGFSWYITNGLGSENSSESLVTAGEYAHGIAIIINDTMYSSDYVAPENDLEVRDVVANFIALNHDKIAREQGVICRTATYSDDLDGEGASFDLTDKIVFQEIYAGGGFDIAFHTIGNDFSLVLTAETRNPGVDMNAVGLKPIIYTRMPSGGEHNSLYNRLVDKSGRRFYYIDASNGDPRLYLYKQYSLIAGLKTIGISYIATSENISDNEPYPVPADYEKLIIKNLVEMFSVMKKAQEDMVNDNID